MKSKTQFTTIHRICCSSRGAYVCQGRLSTMAKDGFLPPLPSQCTVPKYQPHRPPNKPHQMFGGKAHITTSIFVKPKPANNWADTGGSATQSHGTFDTATNDTIKFEPFQLCKGTKSVPIDLTPHGSHWTVKISNRKHRGNPMALLIGFSNTY